MVREDILGGLKLAIAKGQSLKDAMMSFFRAGYDREEIMDAARYLQQEAYAHRLGQKSPSLQSPEEQVQRPLPKPSPKPLKPVEEKPLYKPVEHHTPHPRLMPAPAQPRPSKVMPSPAKIQQIQKPVPIEPLEEKREAQPVSILEKSRQRQQQTKNLFMIIILVFFLFVLIGALVSLFLFKGQIISFFNRLIDLLFS